MSRIPLTEEEKQLPYADFYDRPSAVVPQDVLDSIHDHVYEPTDALLFEDLNDLLLPGYLPMENGYCKMENGGFYVAIRTEFPHVTAEMIDWWFDWHPHKLCSSIALGLQQFHDLET